jgi:hypothetical protein
VRANLSGVGLMLLLGLAMSVPVLGHHGYAAYDMTKTLTLRGAITGYKMANPHSTITFDVKGDKGKIEHWSAEFGYVRAMRAAGWTTESLKPGDQVIVDVHPAKNGTYVSTLAKISFVDGRVLRMGGGGGE